MKKMTITRRGTVLKDLPADEQKQRRDRQDAATQRAQAQGVINRRREAYGSAEQQLEFLAEHGIEAFIARQQAIKAQFPKPESEPPAEKPARKKRTSKK